MMMKKNKENKRQGFSLLELLVVLALLGLLAGFAVPRVLQYLGSAKSETANSQIASLRSALDLYRLENGRYPTQAEGLKALVEKPAGAVAWNGPYIDKETGILDPWGKAYVYRPSAQDGSYALYSLGADGQEGGEGENADIGRK